MSLVMNNKMPTDFSQRWSECLNYEFLTIILNKLFNYMVMSLGNMTTLSFQANISIQVTILLDEDR